MADARIVHGSVELCASLVSLLCAVLSLLRPLCADLRQSSEDGLAA